MFVTTIVLLFIFRLRFPRNQPISDLITRRYGVRTLRLFRGLEQASQKLCKAEKDLHFLICCKAYQVFPKFLHFKLYKKSLCNTDLYRSWQTKLLDIEIESKRKSIDAHKRSVARCKEELRRNVSFIDYHCLSITVSRKIDNLSKKYSLTHEKKLINLGACYNLSSCDPSKVIFNLSSKQLSSREKFLLSFGLDFCLPIFKPNYFRYFLAFESFIIRLKSLSLMRNCNFNDVVRNVKTIACKYYHGFKSSKVFSPIFTKGDFDILKKLGRCKDIVICKPDKGRGVVLMDKNDYVNKMNVILNDHTKFTRCSNDDVFSIVLKCEDQVIRFLKKLVSLGSIGEEEYKNLLPHGSSPAIMYGLPKVHKENNPLRPILAAYNTASFKLAKFVVPLLAQFTKNEFTLKNSYDFYDELKNVSLPNDFYMCSFDVQSLFTNVPLDETINICCDLLFSISDVFLGMNKSVFKNLLSICVKNFYFLFNGILYKQCEGVGMGSPLGPTLANIFLCFHEKRWLDQCPANFKPLIYKRDVDDTFLVFRSEPDAALFLDYLNNKHPNIRFTMDPENNGKISFLDILVEKMHGGLSFSIYRKPTFSGLGISFFSHCSTKFKVNAIKTLLHRAYNLSSSFLLFHKELDFLKGFFLSNGFSNCLFYRSVRRFLNNIFQPKVCSPTVAKQRIYIILPFLEYLCDKVDADLKSSLSRFYPQVDFRFVFKNTFRVGSFFHFKDRLPTSIRSSVIYKFTCPNCQVGYLGSTYRALKTRVDDHIGQSSRTGRPLRNPLHSVVREHSEVCDIRLNFNNFEIVDCSHNISELRILESLYIKKYKPSLNSTVSAAPLYIVD